jgi:hypothetical protein
MWADKRLISVCVRQAVPLVPPEEIQLGAVIATGTFGVVHLATWRGAQVACKKMSIPYQLTTTGKRKRIEEKKRREEKEEKRREDKRIFLSSHCLLSFHFFQIFSPNGVTRLLFLLV